MVSCAVHMTNITFWNTRVSASFYDQFFFTQKIGVALYAGNFIEMIKNHSFS